MPVQQNITVNDGKATPVARIFKSLGVAGGVASYAESATDGSLTKRVAMLFTQKLPGKGRSTALEQLEIVAPYVVAETVNGVTRDTVHSNVRIIVSMVSDPAVPESFINDVFAMGKNALANADIKTAFVAREGIN